MSKIEWTRPPGYKSEVWNPVSGCTRVSAGCDNCYAVTMTNRLAGMEHTKAKYGGLTVLNNRGDRHFNGTVRCHEDLLDKPLSWRTPRCVFVNSMSDLFHANVPWSFINEVFERISRTPHHRYIVLTKRPERPEVFCTHFGTLRSCRNLCIGVSVEDQETAGLRVPYLRAAGGFGARCVSYEPALGPVDFTPWLDHLDWVIVGGESGPRARPFNIEWARSVVRQCREAGVACFVKQLGARPVVGSDWRQHGYGGDRCWRCGWDDRCPVDGGAPLCSRCNATCDRLRDAKGGDTSEWPEDLRVQQWPAMFQGANT